MFDDTRNPEHLQAAAGKSGSAGGMVMVEQHEEQWRELIDKLGATIVATFDARCEKYNDEITRLQQMQGAPDWNYCKVFDC